MIVNVAQNWKSGASVGADCGWHKGDVIFTSNCQYLWIKIF
jgi:hypothetical protein